MNGIKMADCRFYVDKDARTVVCVIPHTRDMVIDFILDHFNYHDINISFHYFNDKFINRMQMPNSFAGRAVCVPEDEWDEELGKLVAFAKAKDKCYKSFFKRANLFVQTLDRHMNDMIETFNDFGLKLEIKREALAKDIESKTKKEGDA